MFLEVEAKYQGTTATGRNGKTKDSEDTLTGAMPLLYNSIEGVREPLDRRKWSCAEPNALANLTKAVRIPTANYKQIEFGPAKTWKTSFSGKGISLRHFPAGRNFRRCENCQQWLDPAADYKHIRTL